MSIWACDSGVFMNFMKSQAAACTSGEPVLVMYQAAPPIWVLLPAEASTPGNTVAPMSSVESACVWSTPAMPVPLPFRNDSTEVAADDESTSIDACWLAMARYWLI